MRDQAAPEDNPDMAEERALWDAVISEAQQGYFPPRNNPGCHQQ